MFRVKWRYDVEVIFPYPETNQFARVINIKSNYFMT